MREFEKEQIELVYRLVNSSRVSLRWAAGMAPGKVPNRKSELVRRILTNLDMTKPLGRALARVLIEQNIAKPEWFPGCGARKAR